MIGSALRRRLSRGIACLDAREWGQGDISHGLQGKSADVRRGHVVGWVAVLRSYDGMSAGASNQIANEINASTAIFFCETAVLPS